MHRIDHATAVATKPAPLAAGTPGFFDRGDPLTGRIATYLTADFANDLQENLCNAIEAAGIQLSKGDGTQLLMAILELSKRSGLPLGVPVPFVGTPDRIPSNCVVAMGQTVQRADYQVMTQFVLASGVIVDDADWLASPIHRTKFSHGDGATTIRFPDLRGEAIYGADLGRGVRGSAIGDWLAGDMQSHNHSASTGNAGGHAHTGTTDAQGGHDHSGETGPAGAWNPAPDGFTRLLKPPYVGSITGSDTEGSGSEQAVGGGDSADIRSAPDHHHAIPYVGPHAHNFSTSAAPDHNHTVTVSNAGGTETRQRGTGYVFIMRVM
ncbi:tail fiber protein [Burkholderia cepacia]|uniref:tail fiber protein n=1 Tax=Burkholderia cepacia TaxID=292 RepID=UPI00158D6EDD|nr:tail fiber protein [Burkholderia cepacia]